VDLAAYAAPAKRVEQRWSGFGRLDWKPSERIGIVLRASGSHLTSTGLHEAEEPLARFGGDYEAVAIQLGSSLHARLSKRLTHELHIGADVSTVQHDDGLVPSTLLSSYGVELGGPVRGGITESRITPRVAALLHLDAGAHRLKAGFSLASHRSDVSRASDGAGSFTFGDTADLAGGVGAWRGLDDVRPAGEFSLVEQAFFLQDSWRLADGLSLTLGARWDDMGLPVDRVEGADSWRTLSGVDNRAVLDPPSRFSPRIGFRWELGARRHWVFEGGAGTFHSLADRRDVAEALTFDRATPVRYGVGAFPAWPDRPSVSDASVVGDQLAILGPDFEGPRTRRIALGLSRATGGWSASIQGIYRHTDQIARRRDLNLPTGPVGLDQYGRPLYGRLQKAGAVVAVEPGTNRRFSGFDAVYAIEATGHSEYVGATLAVERVRERGLSLGSSFTYSRTHDDVGPGLQPSLSPFPDGVDGRDWLAGRSDFNVPSRLLAAAEWRGGADGGFRVGAVYSLQSGGHFTPSVGEGIDANGDGDRSNDPAFIDPALPGMDALIGAHDCLAKRTGTFAERNMCRRASVQRLDLRLAVPVVRTAFGRVDVVVDALDVVATERGPIDRALVNVARSGTLTTDPLTGVTQVPLVVNPNFGRVRADRATGILFRLGVRIVP
jgi:hypothetical protein